MDTNDNELRSTGIRTRLAATRRQFAGMLLVMGLAVLASLPAQAEPGAAFQALQMAKAHMQNLHGAYAHGRDRALVGDSGTAYTFFRGAYVQSLGLCDRAADLQAQNRDTLNRGLYRNRSYQQQAVQWSDTLRAQCGELSYRLSLLVANPLAYQQIAVTDGVVQQVGYTLSRLEQAMVLAQR
jgi:hypothetical protein